MIKRKSIFLKALAVVVFMCFALWIVPLGAYIDVVLEDVLCNGKRAICLCSKNFKSPKSQTKNKGYQSTTTNYRTSSSSDRGLTLVYTIDLSQWRHTTRVESWWPSQFHLTPLDYIRIIEHVPKVTNFV